MTSYNSPLMFPLFFFLLWDQIVLLKHKLINQYLNPSSQTNSDFVAAATRGATAVIDGNIMPINPGESPHLQMFMWNNLFFSQGFDVSEHYQPLGGNTAAHAAAICDLRGAQVRDPDGMTGEVFGRKLSFQISLRV